MIRIIILIAAILLSSCKTKLPPHHKNCYVSSVENVEGKKYSPSKGTAVGAGTGALVCGFFGATAGAMTGMALTAMTFGMGAESIPVLVVSGMLVGSASGAVIGGTGGYVYDFNKAGSGTYEYNVYCDDTQNYTLRITEKKPLRVNDQVVFYWDKEKPVLKLKK